MLGEGLRVFSGWFSIACSPFFGSGWEQRQLVSAVAALRKAAKPIRMIQKPGQIKVVHQVMTDHGSDVGSVGSP